MLLLLAGQTHLGPSGIRLDPAMEPGGEQGDVHSRQAGPGWGGCEELLLRNCRT